jgi:hypothetical protein
MSTTGCTRESWFESVLGSQIPISRPEPVFSFSFEILEISRRVRGPDHPDTVHAMGGLAGVLANEGQYAEAEALTREVICTLKKLGNL